MFQFQTRQVKQKLEWDIHFWLGSKTTQVSWLRVLQNVNAQSDSEVKCVVLAYSWQSIGDGIFAAEIVNIYTSCLG